jgi:hypothetical protein
MNIFQLLTRKVFRRSLSLFLGVWLFTYGFAALSQSAPTAIPSSAVSQDVKNSSNYVSAREYFNLKPGKFNENLYWSMFPIPKVSKEFTYKQRQKIWQALIIAQKRMQNNAVMDCVENHTTDHQYEDETPIQAAQRFVVDAQKALVSDSSNPLAKKRRQYLYIDSGLDANLWGWATRGDSRNVEQDIIINLNYSFIPKLDADDWAGTIVHEILHVYSYQHPIFDESKDHYEQFKGHFVYETGWCVSGDGDEAAYQIRAGVPVAPSQQILPSEYNPRSNP